MDKDDGTYISKTHESEDKANTNPNSITMKTICQNR